MSANHEYMDTGALTEDAVPEVPIPTEQGPIEAPDSPAKDALEPAPDTSWVKTVEMKEYGATPQQ